MDKIIPGVLVIAAFAGCVYFTVLGVLYLVTSELHGYILGFPFGLSAREAGIVCMALAGVMFLALVQSTQALLRS